METRRTNQFLRVALGTRSPARQKLFKGKFHDIVANETRFPFDVSVGATGSDIKPKTQGNNMRRITGTFSRERGEHSEPRAQTTKDRRANSSIEHEVGRQMFNENNRLQRDVRA